MSTNTTDATTDAAQHELAGWLNGTNGTVMFCRCGLGFFARYGEAISPLHLAKERLERHMQEAQ